MVFVAKINKPIDNVNMLCYNIDVKARRYVMITYTFTGYKSAFTNGRTTV